MSDKIQLTIDGLPLECEPTLNLIEAAALLGIRIPHFCWHPDLSLSGNCRLCLVEADTGRGIVSVLACNTKVAAGMKVFTQTENVRKMRQQTLEFFFLNHPLDCPICDKAGECQLQDFYQSYGLHKSRLEASGVSKTGKGVKAQPLSDKIIFDNERCVLCDRCTRFLKEVEGKEELAIVGRGTKGHIDQFAGRSLTGERQLCLTDICPVGALCSRDFRFQKRVWFLQKTKSICGLLDMGDPIFIEHLEGKIYRITPRRHNGVQGVWIKDTTRLAYHDWEAKRLETPMLDGVQVSWDVAIAHLSQAMKSIPPHHQKTSVLLLDTRRTLEEAYALKKLFSHFGIRKVLQAPSSLAVGKGPNGHGLSIQGIPHAEVTDLQKASFLFTFGDFAPEFSGQIAAHEWAFQVMAHTPSFSEKRHLWLPLAEHPERSGSFINQQKRVQRFQQAISPRGEAKNGLDIALAIAAKEGLVLGFNDVPSAFAELAETVLVKPGLTWAALGEFGILLTGEEGARVRSPLGKHGASTWSG